MEAPKSHNSLQHIFFRLHFHLRCHHIPHLRAAGVAPPPWLLGTVSPWQGSLNVAPLLLARHLTPLWLPSSCPLYSCGVFDAPPLVSRATIANSIGIWNPTRHLHPVAALSLCGSFPLGKALDLDAASLPMPYPMLLPSSPDWNNGGYGQMMSKSHSHYAIVY
jgi:hypothetical protein